MPQGLQCFNSEGTMVLDVTDRLTKILGSFITTKVAGSTTDSNILLGTFWYSGVPVIVNGDFTNFRTRDGYGIPDSQLTITASGSTINWYSSSGYYDQYTRALRVWYGIY